LLNNEEKITVKKKKYIKDIHLEILMQKLIKKAYTNPPLAMKVYIMKLTTME